MRHIFVFGSNLAGVHGRGSAFAAKQQHGAITGQGYGFQGNAFAIPTKDAQFRVLSLKMIGAYIGQFIAFAKEHPDWQFDVVEIGCGLAGFRPHQIAPFFMFVPGNCILPQSFRDVLDKSSHLM